MSQNNVINESDLLEGFISRVKISKEAPSEKGDLIPLSGPHKNNLLRLVDSPPYSPDFGRTGDINPNLRVFVANFDGTWNDRSEVPKGESKTLVGLLYEESLRHDNPAVENHYLHGVGTQTKTKAQVLYEGATGSGCQERAEQMHQKLIEAAAWWEIENPDVEIHVHAVGFSRGAATALHFLNLVDEYGAMPVDLKASNGLGAGNVKSSAVLLDVVATGQEKILKLTVPPTTQSVLHLTAGGEERRHFKVTTLGDRRYDTKGNPTNLLDNPEWAEARGVSAPPYVHDGPVSVFNPDGKFIYQRIQQISLAGTRHSDVGGGYVQNGIAGVPMFLVRGFQKSLGLPGAEPVRPTVKEIQGAMAHDSRDMIELTLQSIENFFGKKSRVHQRQIAKEQERPWNGDLLRSVQIHMLNANGEQIRSKQLRMVVPHKEGAEKPTLKELSHNQILSYDPNIRLKTPGSNPFQATQKGNFELAGGAYQKLMFKGVQIDDSNHNDSVFTEFLKNARKKNLQLAVLVEDERLFCPLQEGKQKISPGATLFLPKQQDPWPEGIQNAIRALNQRMDVDLTRNKFLTRLTPMEAKNLLSDAMADAALDYGKAFPQSTKLKFKVGKDEIDPKKNSVHIAVYGDAASAMMSNKKTAEGPEEGNMRHRLKELAEGVDCVVKMLHKSGYPMDGYEVKMATQPEPEHLLENSVKNEAAAPLEHDEEPFAQKRAHRPGMR